MKNCTNKDYNIKKIEIERNFADDVFKKYRYKRYGIGNCCGSDFDDNVNKKALCDHDDNQLTTYTDITVKSTIYTPPEGGAEDDPNRPDWVNALCGMDHDSVQIYFYYDATSLGIPETIAAYTAAQAWVDNIKQDNTGPEYVNCTNIEENSIESYHTTVFGERWLDWATSAMTGVFNNSGSCGGNGTVDINGANCVTGTAVNVDPDPSRNFGTNDCGSAADSAFPYTVNASNKFWGALEWAQNNGKTMYNGGAAGVNGGAFFPTVDTIGIAPAATAKNILVVCFIDESSSPTHRQPYTDQQASGATATWNAATDGTGTVTPCWAADHTEFIAQRNSYLATVPDSSANFYCYPSKPANPGAAHRPFPLHALGAISSGDQTVPDGTFTVAPINSVTLLTAIETSNPYFAQGYGALDQHGWGINPAELPFTPEIFNTDLTEYADITDCNDATCFVFRAVNQDGKPVPCYSIILDGGNIGYTDDDGILRYCIINASVDTNHTLQLCHCFTTTGDCSSQNVTITLTEECPADACPDKPFIACEDPKVDPSGNELSGCLDPLAPNYCPYCTADCAGVVGGSDWSCCDYCFDFALSFSSVDATDDVTNDGSIDLTVSNGTAPYTYAWTGPGGFTATTEDISGLAGGVYTVIVTDSSNPVCTQTLTVFIAAPPSIVFGCLDAGTECDEGMDVAFVIDYSSSMGGSIDQVKAGVASILAQIQSMVGTSDYRISLSIADEYNPAANPITPPYFALADYTSLPAAQRNVDTTTGIASPCDGSQMQGAVGGTRDYYRTAMEMFALNNGASFTTQLNLLNTASFPLGNAGTHNFPEATDTLVDMVGLQDFTGTWRTGVAKYIIVMTDALPAGNDDCCTATDIATLATLSTNLVADGIKVIVVGYGADMQYPSGSLYYPWRVFADDTDGTWDSAAVDYSTATNDALATLCSPLPAACNYDPLATYDCAGVLGGTDFSCCLYSACTDATATNYDASGTTDCNCDPIGTNAPGWNDCCEYCNFGCMDPLANNYDPAADCEDACTYDWTCTESTASNSCDNLTDSLVFGMANDQVEHFATAANNLQYTDIFTYQYEHNQSPLSNQCLGPNGGSYAVVLAFGINMPSNWNMNPSGYTTWNAFITDLSALAFPTLNITSSYSTVEAYMNSGYEGQTYQMESDHEWCVCTSGSITTLNLCETATSMDITTANPMDTATPYNWSTLISTTYPNTAAEDIYFCTSFNYNGTTTNECPCGDDGAGGPSGNFVSNVQHDYDNNAGTTIAGTQAQTWTQFVNDLVYYNVPGVTAGMTYADLQGLSIKDDLGMSWTHCYCEDAEGCTCIEMTDGSGTHADQAACEAAVNCCGNTCGCLDPVASNYNATANGDCADPCVVPTQGYGDTSCCEYLGCMDPLATNYDPAATTDDGSCIYKWLCEQGTANSDTCSERTIPAGELEIDSCEDLMEYLIDAPLHMVPISDYKFCTTNVPGGNPCPCQTNGENYWYSQEFRLWDPGTGAVISATTWNALMALGDISLPGWNVDGTMTYAQIQTALTMYNTANETEWRFSCIENDCQCTGTGCECVEDPAGTFDSQLECEQNGDNCCGDQPQNCTACDAAGANTATPGCCLPSAPNYDPNATCDDGSCTVIVYGCMDCGYIWEAMSGNYCNGVTPAIYPGATNYNSLVTNNSGCLYSACTDVTATNYGFNCQGYEFVGNSPVTGDPYPAANLMMPDGCCTYNTQMTYVPDLNFQAHLTNIGQVSGWWDATGTVAGGDYCFTSEINTYASLDITDKGVADLTGLQDMVGLIFFVAENNNTGSNNTFTQLNPFIDTLVNLEVLKVSGGSGFDYNIPTVDFSNNINITSIQMQYGILQTLDLSQNPDLVELKVDYNDITTIDVTQCTQLTSLWVRYNEIATIGDNTTVLDISQNTLLTQLYVTHQDSSMLTALDVTVNVNLQYLYFQNNSVATIDVTNNVNLLYFQGSNNNITSLDVTNNVLLINLGINVNLLSSNPDFTNNVNLEMLAIHSQTQITALDLTQCTALYNLRCNNNQITTLNLSQNTALTGILCQNNQLTCLNVKNGNNINVGNDIINDFNCSGNLLTDVIVDDVTYSQTNWTAGNGNIDGGVTFTSINTCDYTYIPDTAFQNYLITLGKTFVGDYVLRATLANVTTLNLNSLGVTDLTGLEDFAALDELYISYNTGITSVDLSNNPLLEVFSMQGCTGVTTIDVSMLPLLYFFDSQWCTGVASVDLSNNPAITQIWVKDMGATFNTFNMKNGNNTNVTPAATKFLCTGNPSLTSINCDDIAYATANFTNIDATMTTWTAV